MSRCTDPRQAWLVITDVRGGEAVARDVRGRDGVQTGVTAPADGSPQATPPLLRTPHQHRPLQGFSASDTEVDYVPDSASARDAGAEGDGSTPHTSRRELASDDTAADERRGAGAVGTDSVVVSGSKKRGDKRVYDRKHYCLYCQLSFSKIARHLEMVHDDMPDVARAVSLPKGSKERRKLLNHIRLQGNYSHNAAVLTSGTGELVPCKRPPSQAQGGEFRHCAHCQGLYPERALRRHSRRCSFAPRPAEPGGPSSTPGPFLTALEDGRLAEVQGKNLEEVESDPDEKPLENKEDVQDEDKGGNQEDSSASSDGGAARRKKKNRRWQEREVRAVERHLQSFITSGVVPAKSQCEKCVRAEPEALKSRDWRHVKFHVKNRISARKKKLQHAQVTEEAAAEPQDHGVKEAEPPPSFIKEEAEEAAVTSCSVAPVSVKTEEDDGAEESLACGLIQSEVDDTSFAGPEPGADWDPLLHPDPDRPLSSESDTDDSEDWTEDSHAQSSSRSVQRPRPHLSEERDADSTSVTCSRCGRTCASKSGLTIHMNSCSGASTCSVCGKCCETRAALQIHMRVHSGERPYGCTQCGKCYSRRGHLNVHMRSHNGERPFSCHLCGKCYTRSEQLTRHMLIHTGEKPFICPLCDRCFTRRECLKEHMKIHTGEKPFICPQCGQCFIRRGRLESHMRKHSGEKPFLCSQCGKYFAQRQYLQRHMRIHTGERPYVCSECGDSFALKGSLNKHTKLHTGEKPFLCSQCGKGCTQKVHLEEHMRMHSDEKPFSCSHCGKCFKQIGVMQKHMKIHAHKSHV